MKYERNYKVEDLTMRQLEGRIHSVECRIKEARRSKDFDMMNNLKEENNELRLRLENLRKSSR